MAVHVTLLKTPYEVSFTGNPMPFSFVLSPYREIEKTQDIRLQVRMLVEHNFGSGIFQEVRSQNFYPNSLGMVEVDVHTIIDPYLDFYLPKATLQKAVQAFEQRKRYKITYLLQKDGAVVGSVHESPILFAIKGGMAYQEWHPSEFFTNAIISEKKPLNFFIKGEKVSAEEKRFLYWVYPFANNAQQAVRFEITLNNGADIIFLVDADGAFLIDVDGSYIIIPPDNLIGFDLPGTTFGGKWSIFCAPIGFNQTGLNTLVPAGLYAVTYSVTVLAGDVEIVAPLEFEIDYRNTYKTHQLLYRNSIGGLETLRLRGQVDLEADYTMQQAQRIVPPSYFHNMTVLSQSIQDDNEETTKFKGDTGFISDKAADRLRDLFLSPERYESDNNRFIPVNLNNKNVKFYSNKDSLISIQVEWNWAFSNSYYTPKGLMPASRVCPAIEKLVVKQVSKNMLQVMYALVSPYESIEVQVLIGSNTYTYTYRGNAKTVLQPFTNPSGGAPLSIQVKGRTICNEDSSPIEYGPFAIVNVDVNGNSLPVVNDDNYTISVGYNSAITLPGSVLANDYDPDGDPIEVVTASGATSQGGSYSINAAGIVTYTPPSSVFAGIDYFDYDVKEVGGTTTVTGRVNISVGSAALGVFAKLVYRNQNVWSTAYESYSSGEVWIDFFGDPAGTQKLDVTPLALDININFAERNTDRDGNSTVTNTPSTALGSSTKIKIFEGTLYTSTYDPYLGPLAQEYSYEPQLLPGSGYTVI